MCVLSRELANFSSFFPPSFLEVIMTKSMHKCHICEEHEIGRWFSHIMLSGIRGAKGQKELVLCLCSMYAAD